MSAPDQSDEQHVILEHLAHIERGSVLDVGAYDGVTFSNSLALIRRGWDATLVEPDPDNAAALRELHDSNPRVRVVEAALAPRDSTIEFHVPRQTPGVVHPGLYATTDPAEARRAARRHNITFDVLTRPAIAWSTLLAESHDHHLISIDTEGTSIDRLLELDIAAMRNLRLICVERSFLNNNEPCPHAHRRVIDFAANNFFRLAHETAENLMFARA